MGGKLWTLAVGRDSDGGVGKEIVYAWNSSTMSRLVKNREKGRKKIHKETSASASCVYLCELLSRFGLWRSWHEGLEALSRVHAGGTGLRQALADGSPAEMGPGRSDALAGPAVCMKNSCRDKSTRSPFWTSLSKILFSAGQSLIALSRVNRITLETVNNRLTLQQMV